MCYVSENDYHNESDIPKIIDFLERTSVKNGWDAHIGDGAGDGDIRIPAKYVPGFIEMPRSRPHAPAPETISKELALELCMDARKEAARAATLAENKRVLDAIETIKTDYEMNFSHWDKDEDPAGEPTFGDGAVIACKRISDALRITGDDHK